MKIFKTSLASVLLATACGFGAKPQTDAASQTSPVPSEVSAPSEASGPEAAGVASAASARSDGSAAGLAAAYRNFEKPSESELRQRLSDIQFHVTQADGTERPFANEYWDNKKEGIYVDVVSGEPLFSSRDKFRSGTGWPSFTRPLVAGLVVEKSDRKFGMVRTEVRSRYGDSHLGHLFDDGPAPTGLRYCINSAALRFIPKERLADEGYSAFLAQFR